MEENEKIELSKTKEQWLVTLLLCFLFGIFGIHRFYNKKIWTGILQLFTLGGFGIWVLIDLILILLNKFKIYEKEELVSEEITNKSNKDWFIIFSLCFIFGIFGIHRFYNKKIWTGILQFITLGGLGIWTLIDLITISKHKFLDKEKNSIVKSNKKSYKVALTIFIIILVLINTYSAFIMKNSIKEIKKIQNEIDTELVMNVIKEGYSKVVLMQVFFHYDVNEDTINNIGNELSKTKGIHNLNFVSKEDAYNIMKQKLGNNETALKSMDKDMFPASFTMEIAGENRAKEIYNKMKNMPEVMEIQSNIEIRNAVKNNPKLVTLALIIIYYKEFITILIAVLIIRTIISIWILCSVCKYKNELTLCTN